MSEQQDINKFSLSIDQVLDDIKAETVKIDAIRTSLAHVAVNSVQMHDTFKEASELLVSQSRALADEVLSMTVIEFDDREVFGGEESYFTVLRLFSKAENMGTLLSLDYVWDYLAKNYDMSDETDDSLIETLHQWSVDIKADVKERTGIDGVFTEINGGFVFSYTSVDGLKNGIKRTASVQPSRKKVVKPPIVKNEEAVQQTTEPEVATEVASDGDELIRQTIYDAVLTRNEPYKQADLKKYLKSCGIKLTDEVVQLRIDEIVAEGKLFKHRRNGNAYLWIEAPDEEYSKKRERINKSEKQTYVNIDQAIEILRVFIAPGVHVEKRLTMHELWRLINGSDSNGRIPEAEITKLRQVCRQLEKVGITEVGEHKYGTGGNKTNAATSSKRRRSASHTVFKVRLTSQETKNEIKELFNNDEIEQSLRSKFNQ